MHVRDLGDAVGAQRRHHQAGAGPDVGGADRRRRQPRPAADRRVVAVGADVGAEPDQLVDEHEPAVEDVLGDQRRALADRGQADRQRQQVGGESRERQRGGVDRGRAAVHAYPERVAARSSPRPPASITLSSAISRYSGLIPRTVTSPRVIAAPNAQVPATMRSPTVRCRTGLQLGARPRSTSVDVPAPSIRAPIAVSIVQMSTISGSRAALSISVMPSARTAAIRMFSVAPTLGKSSQISAPVQAVRRVGDHEAVLAGDVGAELGQAGDVHVEAAGADRVAARVRDPDLAAAGQQRAEHADRRAQPAHQVVVGLVAELVRHVDRDVDAVARSSR